MSSAELPAASRADRADVLVVGGSTGGVRTVQALRRAGYDGSITMLSADEVLPYDRPPLSKDLLGADHDGAPVSLLDQEQVDVLDLDLRLGTTATSLDPASRTATLSCDGVTSTFGYDRLVIATGVAARRLPGTEGIDGVHVIRDLDDTHALRTRMRPGARAVVVGAGFIGAEFASAARARGMDVVIVEAQSTPLAHVLGMEVGAAVGAVHAVHGARLLTGRTVRAVHQEHSSVTGVVLDDGTDLPADVVVVGIGATPATSWLEGSGLPVEDGLSCDADLQVLDHPGVYAVGDVARWPHAHYAAPIRVEHWTNAGDHAAIVAAHLTGRPRPKPVVPYVWSDQYGARLQIVGRAAEATSAVVRGSMESRDLLALYADDTDTLVAAVVVDDPRLLMRCRKAIEAGTRRAEVEQALPAPTG